MINSQTEFIWHELHHDLRRFIGRQVTDAEAADDILQDVFLKIHTQAVTLRNEQKLVSWAYQITRNAVADFYRTRHWSVELPETLAAPEADAGNLSSEFALCLRPLVNSLPDRYREVLLLTEYERLTLQQTADRLGLSLSGAKSRVQRARELLKGQLLQCCHFEFDRRGRMIDYYPYQPECDDERPETDCALDSCA